LWVLLYAQVSVLDVPLLHLLPQVCPSLLQHPCAVLQLWRGLACRPGAVVWDRGGQLGRDVTVQPCLQSRRPAALANSQQTNPPGLASPAKT
jgi:hypothetical protein